MTQRPAAAWDGLLLPPTHPGVEGGHIVPAQESLQPVPSQRNSSEENTGLGPERLQERGDGRPVSPPGREGEGAGRPHRRTAGLQPHPRLCHHQKATLPFSLQIPRPI